MIPFIKTQLGKLTCSRVFVSIVAAASLLIAVSSLNAQTPRRGAAQAAGEDDSHVLKTYRGVQLGMMADEVRKKLGEPKDKGDEQDFFVFNETETAQIVYDKAHKVVTISADFVNLGSSVPTPKQVFGSDVETKADGSVAKMVRFPKAGYWLSYYRTAGDSPLTSFTLQKIP